ncbi:MAG: PEP-CTERM sorting domain-containing protein [Isosphaeraceae bacterium]
MLRQIHKLVGLGIVAIVMLGQSVRAGDITIIDVASLNGYQFTNFDGPNPNNVAGTMTNINGISNTGNVVGFTTADNLSFNNFVANPLKSTTATSVELSGSSLASMANGINSSGTVVGFDGNMSAFSIPNGGTPSTFIPPDGTSAFALGINDHGVIVGQYSTATGTTPGFILNGNTYTTVNAPSGPDVVNAQGINNNGLVVGFYVGNDDEDHGFIAHASSAMNGSLTGTAVSDPNVPNFLFSQILGVNDYGIAVGYYEDTSFSQHGFFYNTNTGQYTFLDDPNAANIGGTEITQITGINDSGEITGFYVGSDGLAHGFVALQGVPEPSSVALLGIGLTTLLGMRYVRQRMRKGR